MECSVSTLVNQRWILCTFASLLGFIFVTLYHDQSQQPVTIVASFESLGSVDYKHPTSNTSTTATTSASIRSTGLQVFPLQDSSASVSEIFPRPVDVQDKRLSPSASAVEVLELSSILSMAKNNLSNATVGSGAEKSKEEGCNIFNGNHSSSPRSVDGQEEKLSSNTGAVEDSELSSILSIAKKNFSSTSNDTVSAELEKPKQEECCDVFDGRWVYDSKNYPLYRARQCPFLSEQVSCQKNGRPDSDYERWRWEPRNCEIPRFNGTQVLRTLRGKRVAIVGDSLNRNQWESLSCLLYSSVHPSRAIVNAHRPNKIFHALDYDFSLEFYWSPFLVKLDGTKDGKKVLRLNKLAETRRWRDADVMVFNTGHWWTHRGRTKTWDYYEVGGKLLEEMEGHSAFEMAMQTWARWIDGSVNSSKSSVFFRSISPEHKQWNLHWCHNQIQPISNETYRQSFPASMVTIVEQVIKKMTTPVKYLNITRLSEYRRDAHTSVYTTRQGKLLTKEERKQPQLYADCSHWCLPGLPDTWNALLYASIVGTSSSIFR